MDEPYRYLRLHRILTQCLTTPQIVEKRLIYMTPEWKDASRFHYQMADSTWT
jgi:hypothetical protein